MIYINGEGVEASNEIAAKWMDMAAKGGNAHAMFRLALLYRSGDGVAENKDEYMRWFLLAARNGETDALHYLAAVCSEEFGEQLGKH